MRDDLAGHAPANRAQLQTRLLKNISTRAELHITIATALSARASNIKTSSYTGKKRTDGHQAA